MVPTEKQKERETKSILHWASRCWDGEEQSNDLLLGAD